MTAHGRSTPPRPRPQLRRQIPPSAALTRPATRALPDSTGDRIEVLVCVVAQRVQSGRRIVKRLQQNAVRSDDFLKCVVVTAQLELVRTSVRTGTRLCRTARVGEHTAVLAPSPLGLKVTGPLARPRLGLGEQHEGLARGRVLSPVGGALTRVSWGRRVTQ